MDRGTGLASGIPERVSLVGVSLPVGLPYLLVDSLLTTVLCSARFFVSHTYVYGSDQPQINLDCRSVAPVLDFLHVGFLAA